MSEQTHADGEPDLEMLEEVLPDYLTDEYWEALRAACRRIRRHTEHPGVLRLGDDDADPDDHWYVAGREIWPERVLGLQLDQCLQDARRLGVDQVVAELTLEGSPRRDALLRTLDFIHRGCVFEYAQAETDDERDAIATLQSLNYNLMRDIGAR